MKCKNCEHLLSESDAYCNACGAKVITHRITLRYFFSEFYQSFFSIDANKPLQTFIDMFKKPEAVIDGYIGGVRKKYIHAFGYFTIAITISSIFYFLMFRFFPSVFENAMSFSQENTQQVVLTKKIQTAVFEYQTFLFFGAIPLLAFISWIVFFNKRKYNYAEHLILNLYTYSQISILSIIIYCLTVWNVQLFKMAVFSAIALVFVYYGYVLFRVFKLSVKQFVIKTLYFFILFIPLYIFVTVIVFLLLFLTGNLTEFIEAEQAKRGVTYMVSSVKNWTS